MKKSFVLFLLLGIVTVFPSVLYAQTAESIRLDLIVSAQTYTPSFYNGRALPTSGSVVRVDALLFDGGQLPSNNFSFAWQVNNKTQGSAQGSSLTFIPNFETESIVSVTVTDATGALIAKKAIGIPIFKPQLYFYERNPLRGVLPTAFEKENYFVGEELTLHVEPYFIDARIDSLGTQWSIGGKEVTQTGSPFELTIQKQQNVGKATILFEIFNPQQLLHYAKESITFTF